MDMEHDVSSQIEVLNKQIELNNQMLQFISIAEKNYPDDKALKNKIKKWLKVEAFSI